MTPERLSYPALLSSIFGAGRFQKLALNTAHDCPNRDGTIGTGGCIYCNNRAFSPAYCHSGDSVREQLRCGIKFFRCKYTSTRWLPYFQTFTSTNAPLADLERDFGAVLAEEDVAGLIVSTRPDCLPDTVIRLLASMPKPVMVELGAETMHDRTLRLLNRGHSAADTESAAVRAAGAGLHVCLHLMAGLPGESEDDFLLTIDLCAALPVRCLKLHHLQVLRGTPLERLVAEKRIALPSFTPDSYMELCLKVLRRLPPHIAVERWLAQAPPAEVVAPKWRLKNYQFAHMLQNRLKNNP